MEKKKQQQALRRCRRRPSTQFRASRTLETCELFLFFCARKTFSLFLFSFSTWRPRGDDVREDGVVRRLWNADTCTVAGADCQLPVYKDYVLY